ncbi:MAG: hypothetical protein HOK06_02095 [Rhodospirillaceae bacterium]|nr:hypothetical protein [Rhodospirillaceae bacterium]MBT4218373.1 hypothetical protein [Rhodospirillaceae bacterium]MBT4463829.1 hypothetical protein [Rhodospirillaceae bacterium]MBT5012869.1 hypothetical protein [Rhodospirillaceae bacterium]MBT5308855.1 hypothetical protein [Rhodospirillaceae bacterium]
MSEPLPQQTLLLELLMMSGDIAVPDSNNGTLLYSTLKECEANKWLELTRFGAGFDKARITEIGRNLVVKG